MESHLRKPKPASQQNVARTRKTSTREPKALEEILSLKSGTDVRGKIIALSRAMGNYALQRSINSFQATNPVPQANGLQTHLTLTQPHIQRVVNFSKLPANQQLELIGNGKQKKWTEKQIIELGWWVKDAPDGMTQMQSILANFTYGDWQDIKAVFKKGTDLEPNKAAPMKSELAKHQAKIAAAKQARIAQVAIDRTNRLLGSDPTKNDIISAMKDKRLKLRQLPSFKTVAERKERQSDGTGPITREWLAVIDGKDANWVLHAHFNNVKNDGYEAYHYKSWAARLSSSPDSRHAVPKEILDLALVDPAKDLACVDLNQQEIAALNKKFGVNQ
jgi:hypothetical protein